MSKYVAPEYELDAFNCPHCDAYAHQYWFYRVRTYERDVPEKFIPYLSASICVKCGKYTLWLEERMLYPLDSKAPLPSEDIPEDVKNDFKEARDVVG